MIETLLFELSKMVLKSRKGIDIKTQAVSCTFELYKN
jgi:hypothetical protein